LFLLVIVGGSTRRASECTVGPTLRRLRHDDWGLVRVLQFLGVVGVHTRLAAIGNIAIGVRYILRVFGDKMDTSVRQVTSSVEAC